MYLRLSASSVALLSASTVVLCHAASLRTKSPECWLACPSYFSEQIAWMDTNRLPIYCRRVLLFSVAVVPKITCSRRKRIVNSSKAYAHAQTHVVGQLQVQRFVFFARARVAASDCCAADHGTIRLSASPSCLSLVRERS